MLVASVMYSLLSTILLAAIYNLRQYVNNFSNSAIRDLSCRTTSAPQNGITLDDITITIKTTKLFHEKRVSVLLRTWLKFALNQVRGVWL